MNPKVATTLATTVAGVALIVGLTTHSSATPTSAPLVAVVATPVAVPTPSQVPSPSPTPVQVVAPTPAPTQASNPVVVPPTVKPVPPPTAPPTAKPVSHTVVWNDPSPAIPPTGGGYMGPTVIGSALIPFPALNGTWSCTSPPTAGFEVGVKDLATGQQVWVRFAAGTDYHPDMSAMPNVLGHSYLLMVQFFGDGVTCDWNLTLTA